MDRGWNSFTVHARNITVRGNSNEGSERKEECQRDNFHLLREHKNNNRLNVPRNVNVKDCSGENSVGNEKCVNGKKDILVIKWQGTWLNGVLVFHH